MIVDVHAHLYPKAVLDFFAQHGGQDVELIDDHGDLRIVFRGKLLHPIVPRPMYDIDLRLQSMDANGVAVHALSVPPPMVY